MTQTPARGDVIEAPHKGTYKRRVVAYTYETPAGTIAATLPADLTVSGWWHLDVREARPAADQTLGWSGPAGELRREVFEEHTERPPHVPGRRTMSKHASVFEMVRFHFGPDLADVYEGLCNGRLPDWYDPATTAPATP